MVSFKIGAGAGALIAAASLAAAPLAALTKKECSAAYKSARKSGTLGAMTWQRFRKARCGPGSKPSAASAPGPAPGGSGYLPGGRAIFPTAIAPKYKGETSARARRHTCLDQYQLNRASDANGGLKWVERGGGYYIECNKRLRPPAGQKR